MPDISFHQCIPVYTWCFPVHHQAVCTLHQNYMPEARSAPSKSTPSSVCDEGLTAHEWHMIQLQNPYWTWYSLRNKLWDSGIYILEEYSQKQYLLG